MQLTLLGTGTVLPDPDHHSASFALTFGDALALFDCGSGTVHGSVRYGVDLGAIRYLMLSHFHTDHIGDVAPLLFHLRYGLSGPRTRPLTVLGPEGLRSRMEGLRDAFGPYVLEPGFPLEIVEIAGIEGDIPLEGGTLRRCRTPHTGNSLAFRLETEDGSIGYTGDTGPSESVARFMEGVDVLIAECSFADPRPHDRHLSPSALVEILRRSRPRIAITTHVYPPLRPADVPGLVEALGYRGRVVAGADGMTVSWTGEEEPVFEPFRPPSHRRDDSAS